MPCALLLALCAQLAPTRNVPLISSPEGVAALRLCCANGFTVRVDKLPAAGAGWPAVRISFAKLGEERRLLALQAPVHGVPDDAKALAVRYRLQLLQGDPPRLALVLFEKGGGAWFKLGGRLTAQADFATARVSLKSLRPAAFSQDQSGALERELVERAWLGLVADGPTRGTLEISDASFTTEPYVPPEPLRITGDGPGTWQVVQDPAVRSTLSTPPEGPVGKPCMKFDFTLPGGRHMYALPQVRIPDADLEGYRALRFTYKAVLPAGISGLLVTLSEPSGAQYEAIPYPPASADWTTVTLPFTSFRLGAWTKDPNGVFDTEDITTVVIGVHGTAAGPGGSGTIWVTDVQLVP
jgi:hypothetical protein